MLAFPLRHARDRVRSSWAVCFHLFRGAVACIEIAVARGRGLIHVMHRSAPYSSAVVQALRFNLVIDVAA